MLNDASMKSSRGLILLLNLIKGWALLGGLLLLLVVLMTAYSATAGYLISKPFPGDFELTEIGIAVAAFMFLPYGQLTYSNVSADIFTSKARAAVVSLLCRLGSLIALLFSLLLIWRMTQGLLDHKEYNSITAILQVPIWWAFVPILLSLVLLAAASMLTLRYPQNTPDSPLHTL